MSSVAVDTVHFLISTLADADPLARDEVRNLLVAMGRSAVAPLVEALSDAEEQVRWDAARVLGQIGDRTAAPALVRALGDQSFGVRSLAASGLAAMGRGALLPLLRALENGDPLEEESVYHVLRLLADRGLREQVGPVLAALDGPSSQVQLPLAAGAALKMLERTRSPGGNGGTRVGQGWAMRSMT